MEEIKAILKKHDIAATLILADGHGFSEYLNMLETSWSGAVIETDPAKGEGIRVRIQEKELGKEKAYEIANATYNMLHHFTNSLANHAMVYMDLMEVIEKKVEHIRDPK